MYLSPKACLTSPYYHDTSDDNRRDLDARTFFLAHDRHKLHFTDLGCSTLAAPLGSAKLKCAFSTTNSSFTSSNSNNTSIIRIENMRSSAERQVEIRSRQLKLQLTHCDG